MSFLMKRKIAYSVFASIIFFGNFFNPLFAQSSTASVSGDWSNTATWGGAVPSASDTIHISAGIAVTFDIGATDGWVYGDVFFDGAGAALIVATDGATSGGLQVEHINVLSTADTLALLTGVTMTADSITVASSTELYIQGDGTLFHDYLNLSGTLSLYGSPVILDTLRLNASSILDITTSGHNISLIEHYGGATYQFANTVAPYDTLHADSINTNIYGLTLGAGAPGVIDVASPIQFEGTLTLNDTLETNYIDIVGASDFRLNSNALIVASIEVGTNLLDMAFFPGEIQNVSPITIGASGELRFSSDSVTVGNIDIEGAGGLITLSGVNAEIGNLIIYQNASISLGPDTLFANTIYANTSVLTVDSAGVIENTGNINIGAGGSLSLNASGLEVGDIEINGAGGSLNLNSFPVTIGNLDLTSSGSITFSGGTLYTDTIYVDVNTLSFTDNGTVSNTVPIDVGAGGVLDFGASGVTIGDVAYNGASASIDVTGFSGTIADLYVDNNGSIAFGGDTLFANSVIIDSSNTFTLSDSGVIDNSSPIVVNGSGSLIFGATGIEVNDVELLGGQVNVTTYGGTVGNIEVNSASPIVFGGQTLNVDTLRIATAQTLTISDNGVLNNNSPIEVDGTLRFAASSAGLTANDIDMTGAGSLFDVNDNTTVGVIDFLNSGFLTIASTYTLNTDTIFVSSPDSVKISTGILNNTSPIIVDTLAILNLMTVTTGDIEITGSYPELLLTGGAIVGNIDVLYNAYINLNGGATLTVDSLILNGSTLNFNSANVGILNNLNPIEIGTGDSLLFNPGTQMNTNDIDIYGAGAVIDVNNTTAIGDIELSASLNLDIASGITLNADTINIYSDTLSLSDSGTLNNSVPIFIDSTAIMHISAINATLGDVDIFGGNIDNLATNTTYGNLYFFGDATLRIDQNSINVDTVTVDSGTVIIQDLSNTSGVLNNAGPIEIYSNGIFEVDGDYTLNNIYIVGPGGTLVADTSFTMGNLDVYENGFVTLNGYSVDLDSIYVESSDSLTITTNGALNNASPLSLNGSSTLIYDQSISVNHVEIWGVSNYIDVSAYGGVISYLEVIDSLFLILSDIISLSTDSIDIDGKLQIASSGTINNTYPTVLTSTGELQADSILTINEVIMDGYGATFDVNGTVYMDGDLVLQDSVGIEIASGANLYLTDANLTNIGSSFPTPITFSETGLMWFDSTSIFLDQDLSMDRGAGPISLIVTSIDSVIAYTSATFNPGWGIALNGLQRIGGDDVNSELKLQSDPPTFYSINTSVTTTGDLALAGGDTLLLSGVPALTLGTGYYFTLMDSAIFDEPTYTSGGEFVSGAGFYFNAVGLSQAILTGNWSNTATWLSGVVPSPGDDINIDSAVVVTFDGAALDTTYGDLFLGSFGSELAVTTMGTGSGGLKMTGVYIDTLSGNINVSSGMTLTVDSIFVNQNDTLYINGVGSVNNLSPIVLDNAGMLNFGANANVGDIDFIGTSPQVRALSSNASVGNLNVYNTGTIALSGGFTLNADTITINSYGLFSVSGGSTGILSHTVPISMDSSSTIVLNQVTVGDIEFIGDSALIDIAGNATADFIDILALGKIDLNGFTLSSDSINIMSDTLQILSTGTIYNGNPINIGSSGLLKIDSVTTVNSVVLNEPNANIDVNENLTMNGDLTLNANGGLLLAAGKSLTLNDVELSNVGSTAPTALSLFETGSLIFTNSNISLDQDLSFSFGTGPITVDMSGLDTIIAYNNAVFRPDTSLIFNNLSAIGGNGAGTTLTLQSNTPRGYTFNSSATTIGDLTLAGGDTLFLNNVPALTLGTGHTFTVIDSAVLIDTLSGSFDVTNGTFVDYANAPWTESTISADNFNEIAAPTPKTLYAVAGGGISYKSNDGGETWFTQNNGTGFALLSVEFWDENIGMIGGNGGGNIRKTIDGGATWTAAGITDNVGINEIEFITEDLIWTNGLTGKLWKTSNGGASWTSVAIPGIQAALTIDFVDSLTGWFGGSGGLLAKTTDGGASWTQQTVAGNPHVNEIFMLDATTGWLVCSAGKMFKTTDGGTNWNAMTSGVSAVLNEVEFINADSGWVAGDSQKLLFTEDGGTTWTQETISYTGNIDGLHFTRSNAGFAVGQAGGFFKYTVGPSLIFDPPVVEFDTLYLGNLDSLSVYVHNTGVDPLNVSNISSTTHFAPTVSSLSAIAPGDSAEVRVEFNPVSAGVFKDSIIFTNDDPGYSLAPLYINGIANDFTKPNIALNPIVLNFDTITVGLYDTLTVWVVNDSGALLDIDSISLPVDFDVFPYDFQGIAPNDSTEFSIVFHPAFDTTYTDSLLFYSNDTLRNPIALDVLGEGLFIDPNLRFNPVVLDFDTIQYGLDTTLSVWVVNDSGGPLDVDSIFVPLDFLVTPTDIIGIQAGDSAQFTMTFAPSSIATFSDSILFYTNGIFNNPAALDIVAEGIDSVYWRELTTGFTENINEIAAPTPKTLYAVANSGISYKSNDGGETWFAQNNGTAAAILEVKFYDENIGMLGGNNGGNIRKTVDGGATFTDASIAPNVAINAIEFITEDHIWTNGLAGTLWETFDGGGNWTSVSTPGSNIALTIEFVDSLTGWYGGAIGQIGKTTDGGVNWTAQTVPTNPAINDIHMYDSNLGWIVCAAGKMYKTTDGGTNWIAMTSGVSAILNEVEFINADTGWVAGDSQNLLYTEDGGTTWTKETIQYTGNLDGLHMLRSNVGFVAGQTGGVLKYHIGPVITVEPSRVKFDSVDVNATGTYNLFIYNTGIEDLNVSSITASGDFTTDIASAGPISIGDSAALSIYFNPTGAGEAQDSIILTSDDPGLSNMPFTVAGVGFSTVGPDTSLIFDLDTLYFSAIDTAGSTINKVWVINNGVDSIDVDSIVVSSIDSLFTPDAGSIIGLAPGDSVQITVSFAPNSVTSFEDTLLFYSNGIPKTLRLFGDGTYLVNVTFTVNTATVPDTIMENSFVQVRGEYPLEWVDTTPATMTNIGGDYWQVTTQLLANWATGYKYFANPHSTLAGVQADGDLGWEDEVTTGDRVVNIGSVDTTLALEFVNGLDGTQPVHDFRPYEEHVDTLNVLLRVNMADHVTFNPGTQFVGVIGGKTIDSSLIGNLSWTTNVLLNKETSHTNIGQENYDGTNFWSGNLRIPRVSITGEDSLDYKFVILDSYDINATPASEEIDPGRKLYSPVSEADTTIHWDYFEADSLPSLQMFSNSATFGGRLLNHAYNVSMLGLSNTSMTDSVTISAIASSDAVFAVTSPTLPITIGPDSIVVFDVSFTPISLQSYSADLTITDDQSTGLVFKVTGEGIGSVSSKLGFLEVHLDGVAGVDGVEDGRAIVVSPDDKNVYFGSSTPESAVGVFTRNTTTGLLTYLESHHNGVAGVDGMTGMRKITISPDGLNLYVNGRAQSSIAIFSRDTLDGSLTYDGMVSEGTDGVSGIGGGWYVEISPDGNFVYGTGSNSIAVFRRNYNGSLTFVNSYFDGVDGFNLGFAWAFTISPDGNNIYHSDRDNNRINILDRNISTGELSYQGNVTEGAGGVTGLLSPLGIKVSPDGNHVYSGGWADSSMVIFDRDLTSGALTFNQRFDFRADILESVFGISQLNFSDAGDHLFAAVQGVPDGIISFDRDSTTGGLSITSFPRLKGGVPGLNAVTDVAISHDGNHLYSAAGTSTQLGLGGLSVFELNPSDPTVSSYTPSLTFPTKVVGELDTLDVSISNTGAGFLQIDSLLLPQNFGYNSSFDGAYPIDSTTIQIIFEPSIDTTITDSVYFYTNDPVTPTFGVSVSGSSTPGDPHIDINPITTLFFDSTIVGDSVFASFDVSNMNTVGVLHVDSLSSTQNFKQRTLALQDLFPGEIQNISYWFKPQSDGIFDDSITVYSNDVYYAQPLGLRLYGVGIDTLGVSNIRLNPITLNFDSVQIGDIGTLTTWVVNDSGGTLVVDSIVAPPEFTYDFSFAPISANDSLQLTVYFDPVVADSNYADSIYVFSNDSLYNPLSIVITGVGIDTLEKPNIRLNPVILNFDSLQINSLDSMAVWVVNDSGGVLHVDSIYTPVDFWTTWPDTNGISGSDSSQIWIYFNPSIEQTYVDSLLFFSDDSTNNPVKLTLQGVGTDSLGKPNIRLNPVALTFDSLQINTLDSMAVWVVNDSGGPLYLDSISMATDFWTSIPDSIGIQPNDSSMMWIYFGPTFDSTYVDSLLFFSNDSTNNPVTLNLQGVGVDTVSIPSLRLNPVVLNFDSVQVGGIDSVTVWIVNDSSGVLYVDSIYTPVDFWTTWPDTNGIASQDSSQIWVYFNPSIEQSYLDSILFFSIDIPISPIRLDIQGVGIDTLGKPSIRLNPIALDFDSLQINSLDSIAVWVVNDSGGPLYLDSISMAADFWTSIPDSMGIAPNDSSMLWIYFGPTFDSTYVDSLLFYSNDSTNSPVTMNLQGVGVDTTTYWVAQTSGIANLFDVYFSDAATGWIVGDAGAIENTTSGGAIWSAQTSGTANNLYVVHFFDADTGWAVGDIGTILKTIDGGATWGAQTSNTSDLLLDVYFTDANIGWAVGASGTIMSTTNSGVTWSAQTSNTAQILRGVIFTDASTGWAVGNTGVIQYTLDGGSTWSAQTSNTAQNLFDVYFIDANTGWAVGDAGVIQNTTDGGSTWSAQTSGTTNLLNGVNFNNSATGWAVGVSGDILKTADGGTTWSVKTSGTTTELRDVHFTDTNTGWAVGLSGVVLKYKIGPSISLDPVVLMFDTLQVLTSDTLDVMVHNYGISPLNVSNISSIVDFSPEVSSLGPINPGDSSLVSIIFTPVGEGLVIDTLHFTSDDSGQTAIPLAVQGVGIDTLGIPHIRLNPIAVNFDSLDIGSIDSMVVWIVNDSGGVLSVDSISSIVDFTALPPNLSIIQPTDSAAVIVYFTPTTITTYIDSFLVYSNDSLFSPVSFVVQGKGIDSVLQVPEITVSPTSLAFGAQSIGTSASQIVYVINSGGDSLLISSSSIGTGYTVSPDSGISIAPGDSVSISVTFTPTSSITYNDSLVFNSNDSSNPAKSIALSGNGTAPVLTLSNLSVSVGIVAEGSSTSYTVYAVNTGNATLNISNVTAGNGFTVSPASASNIAPSDTAAFTYTFSPVAQIAYSDSSIFTSNDPVNSSIKVLLAGTGIASPQPIISVAQPTLNFGSVEINQSDTLGISVQNTGTAILAISNISSPTGFVISPQTAISLDPDSAMSYSVIFTPDSARTYTGSIIFTTNDTLNPTLSVTVQGSGTPLPIPVITVTPTVLDFDSVIIGETDSIEFIIQNNGNADLTISSFTPPVGFSLSPNQVTTITPSASSVITLFFQPVEVRSYSDSLLITSNDTQNSPYILPITAYGSAIPTPKLEITETEFNFGEVQIGESDTLSFSIHNSGNSNLKILSISEVEGFVLYIYGPPEIGQGSSLNFDIVFNAVNNLQQSSTIIVQTNDSENPSVELHVSGSGIDLTPPIFLEGPFVVPVDTTTAEILWVTNEVTKGVVRYQQGELLTTPLSFADNTVTRDHHVVLSGLIADTLYTFEVSAVDTFGNAVTALGQFKTPSRPDQYAPIFSLQPAILEIDTSSALVHFVMDEPARIEIYYNVDSLFNKDSYITMENSSFTEVHDVKLEQLIPSKRYKLFIRAYDVIGNGPAESFVLEFQTPDRPDTYPPFIIGIPEYQVLDTARVQIFWQTDEPANSTVHYRVFGETTEFSLIESDEFITNHFILLENLATGTEYEFFVASSDARNNGPTESGLQYFETKNAPDLNPPVITGLPFTEGIDTNRVSILWKTNEPTESLLEISLADEWPDNKTLFEDSLLTIMHKVVVPQLETNSLYRYRVGAVDGSGNGPIYSLEYEFKTLSRPDVEPPLIIGIPEAINIDTASVTIVWKTNEPANSVVEYAIDSLFELGNLLLVNDLNSVTDHVVTLTNLTPGKTYRFYVSSTDEKGNGPTISFDQDFTTALAPDITAPSLVGFPEFTGIDTNRVTLLWGTNERTVSEITIFSLDEDSTEFSFIDNNLMKNHNLFVDGLKTNTEYKAVITSIDGSQNITLHDDRPILFRTLAIPDLDPPVFVGLPDISGIDDHSATITIFTNEPTEITLIYAPTESFNDPDSLILHPDRALLDEHSVSLFNLGSNMEYSFKVTAFDGLGNGPAESQIYTFKTQPLPDVTPPLINGFPTVFGIDTNSAIVEFETDEASNTEVHFWETEDSTSVRILNDNDLVTDHEMYIDDLVTSTSYTGFVLTIDAKGNGPTKSGLFTFVTLSAPDIIPPILIGIAEVVSIDTANATIRFRTDEEGTTIVKYYLTSDSTTALNYISNDLVVNHEAFLPNLTSTTEYSFKVGSIDARGNGPILSEVYSFVTASKPDITPPVILGIPSERNLDTSSVTIIWRTNEESNSKVDVWEEENSTVIFTYQNGALVLDHKNTISGLKSDTQYEYIVSSVDAKNNGPTVSAIKAFITPAVPDIIPPKIISAPIVIGLTHKSANIKFKTNEIAFITVEFGVDSLIDQSVFDKGGHTTHIVNLTNLTDSTDYFFRVRGRDSKNNEFVYPEDGALLAFRTKTKPLEVDLAPPRIIEGPVEIDIEPSSFSIFWKTDKPSNSVVEFGLNTELGQNISKDNSQFVQSHFIEVTNLQADKSYFYRLKSTSDNNITVASDLYQVFTPATPDTFPPVIMEGPIVTWLENDNATIEWNSDKPASSRVEFGFSSQLLNRFVSENESDNVTYHQIRLTDLEPDSLYFYSVSSIAGNGRKVESLTYSFKTPAAADAKDPIIESGPSETVVEQTSVTIEWDTDELSNSVIEYGVRQPGTPVYIDKFWIDADAAGVIHHSAVLTGLLSGTEYNYHVISTDLSPAQNTIVSRNKKFTTAHEIDITPPILIAGPIVDRSDRYAILEWKTDEASDTFVFIRVVGDTGNFRKIGNSSKVRVHVIRVNNLKNGIQYEYEIASRDISGNLMTWPTQTQTNNLDIFAKIRATTQPPGGGGSFYTNQQPDTQLPIIIDGPAVAAKTTSTITVKWKTDERSDSFVEFGFDDSYGLVKSVSEDVTEHSIVISNLEAGVRYNFRVNSTDPSNNGPSFSANAAVTTDSEEDLTPPIITAGPIVESITNDQATIVWETDELSDTQVDFGLDDSYGTRRIFTDDSDVHTMTLTNLIPGTAYHFMVSSTDPNDNGPSQSSDVIFSTQAAPDIVPPVISDMSVTAVSDKTAQIIFMTNELSDTFADYGLSSLEVLDPSGLSTGNTDDVTTHIITLTNLIPDTLYYYRSGTIDKSGNESLTEIATFRTADNPDNTPPAKPFGFKGVGGSGTALLMWKPNSDADLAGYNIYRKFDNDFQLIESLVADTFYYDTGIYNWSTYEYRITAVDKSLPANESEPTSKVVLLTNESSKPGTPVPISPLNDEVVSSGSVALLVSNGMTPPGRSGMKYQFVIAEETDFFNQVAFETGVEEGATETGWQSLINLNHDQRYYWKARATDGFFFSDWTAPNTFIADSSIVTSVNMAGFWGESIEGKVHLGWRTGAENYHAGFNLFRSASIEDEGVVVNKAIITGYNGNYNFIDETVQSNRAYFYRLEAVSLYGLTDEVDRLKIFVNAPMEFKLYANYPNPFNNSTHIRFDLPKNSNVRVSIYNILGQEVKRLIDNDMIAGYQSILWDGTNNAGRTVASGVYIYRIIAAENVRSRKMLMIK